MTKKTVTLELDVPEGYEVVGWRPPMAGEWAISTGGSYEAVQIEYARDSHLIILRKLPSPTLPVELPRATVTWIAGLDVPRPDHSCISQEAVHVARAALVAEARGTR